MSRLRLADAGKRAFDFTASLLGLIALLPVLLVVAVAIKTSSPGPILYSQARVGRDGRTFRLHKFRTMVVGADRSSRLTTGKDARVTRVGRFLRKSNLDELPQLVNVFLGQMSIVGPRPEVSEFVDLSDPRWKTTLSVRPGLTAPITVEFRNEGEILSTYSDPVAAYRAVILPTKLDGYVDYVRKRSFLGDIRIIFATFLDIAGIRRRPPPDQTAR